MKERMSEGKKRRQTERKNESEKRKSVHEY